MIYVVEDDKSIRELVAYALGSAGYETESYTSSAEFFAALVPQRARRYCAACVRLRRLRRYLS